MRDQEPSLLLQVVQLCRRILQGEAKVIDRLAQLEVLFEMLV